MEDGLVHFTQNLSLASLRVLILVVMEDGLVHGKEHLEFAMLQWS